MIIIVGGGISGLAAAFHLAASGVPFQVLESADRVGGLIRTEQVDGFTIDAGADSMLSAKPAAAALCGEAGLQDRVQHVREPRTAYVLAGGRLFPLPSPSVLGLPLTLAATARFDLLPRAARARLALERFVPPKAPADESVASFFSRRFGRAAAERVAQPLLGGIHSGDVAKLSVQSLFPQLQEAEATGSVLRSLARRGHGSGNVFTALREGMESLPRALADALPPGSVRCGTEVRAIRGAPRGNGGWDVETSGGATRAAAVIVAAPMPAAARLLRDTAPGAAALCAEIPHASSASVVLAWPREAIAHPLAGTGFVVVPGGPARITACTWVSSKWDGRAPEGYALLRAFLGGVRDPQALEATDDEIVATAVRDLGRVLDIAAPPVLARVYRWRDASPQLNVGHDERVRRIASELSAHPGLLLTGRGFRAVGIPDCIADARAAAEAAARYTNHL